MLPTLFQPKLPALLKRASTAPVSAQPAETPSFGWLGSTVTSAAGQAPVAAAMSGYLAASNKFRPMTVNPYPRVPGDAAHSITTGGRAASQQQVEALARRMGLNLDQLSLRYQHGLPAFQSEASVDPFFRGTHKPGTKMVVNLPPSGSSVAGSGAPRVARGVAAHELGHAAVGDRLRRLGGDNLAVGNQLLMGAGKLLGGFSPLGVALSGNDDNAWRWAQAGTVAHAPVMLNELAASHIGGRHLAGYHGGGWRPRVGNYFSAYRGVPSYAITGALPMSTFGARKLYKYVTGTKDRGDVK